MFLEKINSPSELKKLNIDELKIYAAEIREFLVDVTAKNGGHLASNLGAVELAIALHYVFDCPNDKFLFDVGHQAYIHKLITGRRDGFFRLRQNGGVSGFPSPEESDSDPFVTGHSSTSLSLALGMARARDLSGENYNIIPVIGDGSFTGGMVYEALNDIGENRTKLTIILNDNRMSISKNISAISKYFTKLRLSRKYNRFRANVKKSLSALPFVSVDENSALKKAKIRVKEFFLENRFFENFGISYYGPIDGHNLRELINVFKKVSLKERPAIIHLVTKKGKGYKAAEDNPEKFHGLPAAVMPCANFSKSALYVDFTKKSNTDFGKMNGNADNGCILEDGNNENLLKNVLDKENSESFSKDSANESDNNLRDNNLVNAYSGEGILSKENYPEIFDKNCFGECVHENMIAENEESFSTLVGEVLADLADVDDKIVAITAAMGLGSGLDNFARRHPDRYFDVSIAEQHAVSLAAGLAKCGFKPFFAVYSTFLQRGFDQILHEVSLNNLPVRFLIDRAGAVGGDGATHQGIFDLSYLSLIPGMTIAAPKDGCELVEMIKWAMFFDGPLAIRYPKSYVCEKSCPSVGCAQKEFKQSKNDLEKLKRQSDPKLLSTPPGYINESANSAIEAGRWEVLKNQKTSIFILACGSRMVRLALRIPGVNVINAKFIKPLDEKYLDIINKKGNLIITLEDNILHGGFGHSVLGYLNKTEINAKLVSFAHPDNHLINRDIDGSFIGSKITEKDINQVICAFFKENNQK